MSEGSEDREFSRAVIELMKGVADREHDVKLWQSLEKYEPRLRDHFRVMGLEFMLDQREGYAYLRQVQIEEGEAEPLPHLMRRQPLSYQVSLLLALLRRRLAEFESRGAEERLILEQNEIVEMLSLFLPDTSNEVKLSRRIDSYIEKIVDLGFLRRLRAREDRFEVSRLLKVFVDGQWLGDFDQRLAAYRDYALRDAPTLLEEAP